jgi:hypothetical protein
MNDKEKTCRSFRSLLIQTLTVVVITLLLLEGVGLVFYFQKYGELYYSRSDEAGATESQRDQKDQALQTKKVLHPFMGFVFRPSLPMSRVADARRIRELLAGGKPEAYWTNLKTNNHGFFSAHDYPHERENSRELVIGVFGGSVAQWFALQGAERLKKELRENSFFRDRDIAIMNYAQGGFKQPQQVQALSYFLSVGQHFDFVVNIDGFNEIALSHINHRKGVDTSMPSAQQLLPLLGLMDEADSNMEMINDLLGLRQSELNMMRMEQWKSSTRSAGLHLILSLLYTRVRDDYSTEQQAIASLRKSMGRTSLVHLSELSNTFDMSDSISVAMDLWLGAAVTMQELCNGKGIPYLEVIQPNQYFSKKEFSAQEQALAINEDSPYREPIKSGYQHLPELVQRMRQEGVNVVSAAGVFDEVREETYSDSCCHYNQTGNEILAKEVAESLIELVEGRHSANPEGQGENNRR